MMGAPEFDLSAKQARRLAIAAQGLARPRPGGRVDTRHLRRAIEDVGLLQLDSVNVFCRSHYMPVFSRLGPYPREALDRLAAQDSTKAEVVKLRFFAGLENREIAELLGISERTVERAWRFAKAWLLAELGTSR